MIHMPPPAAVSTCGTISGMHAVRLSACVNVAIDGLVQALAVTLALFARGARMALALIVLAHLRGLGWIA